MLPTAETLLEQSAYFLPKTLHAFSQFWKLQDVHRAHGFCHCACSQQANYRTVLQKLLNSRSPAIACCAGSGESVLNTSNMSQQWEPDARSCTLHCIIEQVKLLASMPVSGMKLYVQLNMLTRAHSEAGWSAEGVVLYIFDSKHCLSSWYAGTPMGESGVVFGVHLF